MKVNSPTVARAGLESGSTICHHSRNSEQPSMRAWSIRSRGMVRKNCRSRKMKKALPKKAGTLRGRKVLIQPSLRNTMKIGIMVTWPGSIIVLSIRKKTRSRLGQRRMAKL